MANQKRVNTTYDSGGNNTQKPVGSVPQGDWGNDVPQQSNNADNNLLDIVMGDFKLARDYIKNNYQSDWNDYWKCYNNIRTRRGYEGISDDFVPETFTIIESVKANIAGGKPKWTFVPMREEQKQDTDVLNQLMDFYWDQNRMVQKTQNWVQDMLIYGNGILMVAWENEMPKISNIPLADFFVDPTATHLNNPEEEGYAKYAGYRYLTDRDSLRKKKIIDPDTGNDTDYYKNIDQIEDYSADWDKLDKEQKESISGSTLGEEAIKRQVECIVYYTKKKKIVVANRKTIIYEGKNPYQRAKSTKKVTTIVNDQPQEHEVEIPEIKPFLPFCILRNYVDGSLFYAKGDVSVIIDRQETLNDISNQKQDNITYVLNNMWQIDPQFSHLAEQIESVPGAVYPIPKGALTAIEKQVVTSEADVEIQRVRDEMRRATAADEVVQGASQEKGRITATEVQAQINQASQRFATKINTLESEGYAQLGRILFKMTQIFVTQEMAVRIIGPDGTSWKDYDPTDYTGEYEPKVSLESTQKVVKAEEGQKYLQVHQTYADSPLINQKEFARVYLEKVLDLPEERIKALLDVPPPPPTPPMPAPNISVSLRSDLQPDQEAALLAKLGIPTSQSDLMLAAGLDHAQIAGNLQDPNVDINPQPGAPMGPDMGPPDSGTPSAPPSGDTGAGPAGPTPPQAA